MSTWKRRAVVVLAVSAVAGFLTGNTWDAGFESAPSGADLVSDLDTSIQQLKLEIRNRSAVEEIFGIGSADNGLNRLGSARVFSATAVPTVIAGPGQYNAAATAYDVATLTVTELGGTDDIGAGRLWDDTDGTDAGATSTADNHLLQVYDQTLNTFTPVTARSPDGGGIGSVNLVYNGSFEVTDGTGLTAASCAACVSGTGVASGWAVVGSPDLSFVDPVGVSEGEGLAARTTASGAPLEGLRQSFPSLKASTVYVFRVRTRATAGDTCTLTVADGTTTASDVSLTTAVFETLEVQLTTTAGPATVNLDLLSTAAGDICDWDEVTVLERYAAVAPAGAQYCIDSDSSSATNYGGGTMDAVPGLACSITPPQGKWFIEVEASVCADNDDGNERGLEVELLEAGTPVAWSAAALTGDAPTNQDFACVPVRFVREMPTPGTTLAYTLTAGSNGTNIFSNQQDAAGDSISAFTPVSTLRVKLVRAN